jgi:hypothetical protein
MMTATFAPDMHKLTRRDIAKLLKSNKKEE